MTQKYGKDSSVTALLDKMDFVILPVLNVDGYAYTWINPVSSIPPSPLLSRPLLRCLPSSIFLPLSLPIYSSLTYPPYTFSLPPALPLYYFPLLLSSKSLIYFLPPSPPFAPPLSPTSPLPLFRLLFFSS